MSELLLRAALTAVLCPQARTLSGRSRVQGGFEDVFSLEVLGPVLPHALHALTLVLGPAQRGAFRALLSPHEPSAAFNAGPGPPQVRIHLPRPCPGMGRANRDLPLAGLGTRVPGIGSWGPGARPPPAMGSSPARSAGATGTPHTNIHSVCAFPSQEDVQQDLPACGLHPKTLDQLSQCPTLGKSSIRLLEMKDYSYTWKV